MFGPPSCANNEQWSVDRATSITTLPTGAGQCYSALFSPHTPSLLSTAGQDGTVRLWDLRTTANPRPGVAFQPQMSFRAGPAEILAADWNKYHPGVLATAGKDGVVRVWDTRNPSRPTAEMQGHSLAIRKVQ
jgi:peroxin-7